LRVDHVDDVDHWLEAASHWKARGLRIAAVTSALLLLWVLYAVFGSDSLDRRARTLARALASGDAGRVAALAASSTESDLENWYQKVRPRVDELKTAETDEIRPSIRIQSEDARQGAAQVVVVLGSAREVRPIGGVSVDELGMKGRLALELPVFWTVDGWGRWRIDGTRTFQAADRLAAH
jgi:hypothetical protein